MIKCPDVVLIYNGIKLKIIQIILMSLTAIFVVACGTKKEDLNKCRPVIYNDFVKKGGLRDRSKEESMTAAEKMKVLRASHDLGHNIATLPPTAPEAE